MPLVAWFRPPRQVLPIFLTVAVVSATALGGLTWQILEQDRDLELQRRQVQLEQTADTLVAAMQQALTGLEVHLPGSSPRERSLPSGVVAVSIAEDEITTGPAGSLPYLPHVPPAPNATRNVFAAAERLEFEAADMATALGAYARLAGSTDAVVRAGALMRMARVHRKRVDHERALEAYGALAALDPVVVDGLPAGLVARYGQLRTLESLNRAAELREEATALFGELQAGRWPLTRAQYEAYTGIARPFVTNAPADDPESIARADAALWLWERRGEEHPVDRRALTLSSGPALVTWTSTATTLDGVIAGSSYLTTLASGVVGDGYAWAISDLEGQPLVGGTPPAGQTAVRTALTSGLPWTLHVFSPEGQSLPASPRRPLLLLVLGLVTLVLAAGWYFIYRALTRERHVARLQSDFVAAVSHEFRSPITALSHATDLLVEDRLPSETLRRQAYDVLARDTSRLRALVEGLLDFGRVEAGAVAYRFEPTDVAELVRSVVADVRESASARDHVVEVADTSRGVRANIDREAIGRSLRNLLDNAVKYSPDERTIRVEISQDAGFVTIAVRDRGIGIPAAEQHAIFERFVRGAESKSRGIQGTGIGLAMVRQTVRAHDGDVTVESEPGRGSVFTVRIPASAGAVADEAGADRAEPRTEAARS